MTKVLSKPADLPDTLQLQDTCMYMLNILDIFNVLG